MSDVVITVPGWYTDIQRRALLDAAQIAGLNVLRLINDTTAVALGYGITKSDLPEAENPRHVVFVDVGHSSMSVSVVAFSKGQLTVKSTAYDQHVGGRDIDYALLQHFAAEFKEKYKIDVLSNPKAIFRLSAGCDRVKKVLSANAESPLNVESIMNDVDAHSRLTREEYEELISGVLSRLDAPLHAALADSGLTIDEIDAVELVGGCTRIPAVRQKIQNWFGGKQLSTTLNQDEAAARGATFSCAMLSPIFRVREFSMVDITPYSVTVSWEREPEDEDNALTVFPKGNNIPSTKVLTFYRKAGFDVEAHYAEPAALPGAINPWIAKFTAKSVEPQPNGDYQVVKVKTRLNANGVLSFEQAYTEEIEEKEDAMQVDGAEGEAPKKKRVVKKHDVAFVWGHTGLDSSVIAQFKELENQMHAADKLVYDTEVWKAFCCGVLADADCVGFDRNGRTRLRSSSTTLGVGSTSAMPRTFSPKRRRRSSSRSGRPRTGCTLRTARTRPSRCMLAVSTSCTDWRTRSSTASRRRSSGHGWSASFGRRSTTT